MESEPEDMSKKLLKVNHSNDTPKNTPAEPSRKQFFFQGYIFVLTFFTYAILHTSREAWAFLKSNIEEEESPGVGLSGDQLGTIDMVFLGFYSIGLYVSGVLGDNMNKRFLIGIGYLLICGISIMIGLGGVWKIRSVWYYTAFFAISGIVQSVGWPSVVAIMANWFSRKGRGFWFGLWSSNPNFGNIIGSLLCNLINTQIGLNWMWTWIIISIAVGVIGLINLFFVVEHPSHVGLVIKEGDEGDVKSIVEQVEDEDVRHEYEEEIEHLPHGTEPREEHEDSPTSSVVDDGHEGEKSINFFKAWLIPGVLQFSICYLGLKLANYGIMLWLPLYSQDELGFNDDEKTLIAVLYDVGTIIGSVALGLISDWMYGKRCPVSYIGLLLATVGHILLIFLTSNQKVLLYILIFILGFLVGGISNLVAGTACADLGKQDALKNNSKALSTVTGIVDGTGSVGAAIGQKGIGYLQDHGSWTGVFILMTCFVFLSSIPLTFIFIREVKEIFIIKKLRKTILVEHEEVTDDEK